MQNPIVTSLTEIPLAKLVVSAMNVRRVASPAGIEELAASIAAHGLLQNLTVKAERNNEGHETGRYEVVAGGRRFAALKRLAKKKLLAKSRPIPCQIIADGAAQEASLAENVVRENLHPADEFEAFRTLSEQGNDAEAIAVRFGKAPRFVRQRLKLAAVSPKLMQAYRGCDMTLEQLMAFTVSDNHVRQEQVWSDLSWNKTPDVIRHALLEDHVSADDKRVRFVGLAAYEAAGGAMVRDLFADEGEGYLNDPALLDGLVKTKLDDAVCVVKAEGWKWVEASADFPHGNGLSRVSPQQIDLEPQDAARMSEIGDALDAFEEQMRSDDDLSESDDARYRAVCAEWEELDGKRHVYDPADIARSGAFVFIGHEGTLDVVRGFVRREDARRDTVAEGDVTDTAKETATALPEKLVRDLQAQKSVALRALMGGNAQVALDSLVHTLALQIFYRSGNSTCLDVSIKSVALERHAPSIVESIAGREIAARHDTWLAQLPEEPDALWRFVLDMSDDSRLSLLAHCVALSVDVSDGKNAGTHGGLLCTALDLDMRRYWTPTAANYFGRVSKKQILDAVSEAVSPQAAHEISDFKKGDMAGAAERQLADTDWLPEILRSPKPDRAEV